MKMERDQLGSLMRLDELYIKNHLHPTDEQSSQHTPRAQEEG